MISWCTALLVASVTLEHEVKIKRNSYKYFLREHKQDLSTTRRYRILWSAIVYIRYLTIQSLHQSLQPFNVGKSAQLTAINIALNAVRADRICSTLTYSAAFSRYGLVLRTLWFGKGANWEASKCRQSNLCDSLCICVVRDGSLGAFLHRQ